jgi:hypothetical protein
VTDTLRSIVSTRKSTRSFLNAIFWASVAFAVTGCRDDVDVEGRLVSEEHLCLHDVEIVGKVPADRGCTLGATFARNSSGDCYWFSNNCFPYGFTQDESCDPGGTRRDCSSFRYDAGFAE